MKTIFRTSLFILFLLVFSAGQAQVYGSAEEIEGKTIWEKLQAKQLECKDLTNSNFELLGEYFMGQTAGDSHESMNKMMVQMMGEKGEEQMHIAMGKRLSGCDSNAAMRGGGNYMPALSAVEGMGYGWDNMMAGWGGFGLGWLFMLPFWALLILGVIALIRYLGNSGKSSNKDKSPLDILERRYAGGEIDKKEFEEKKKDLS
jgi:putative membrane protein